MRGMDIEDLPKSPCLYPFRVTLEAGRMYKYCTCGRSKTQPWCDGSHAGTKFMPKFVKSTEYVEHCFVLLRLQNSTFIACIYVYIYLLLFLTILAWTFRRTKQVQICGCKRTATPPFCDGSHIHLPE